MKITKQRLREIIKREISILKEDHPEFAAAGGGATLTDDPLESLKAMVETWNPPQTAESQSYYFDIISLLDHFEPGTLDRMLPRQGSKEELEEYRGEPERPSTYRQSSEEEREERRRREYRSGGTGVNPKRREGY